MKIKLTVFADAEKIINVNNETWNKMDDREKTIYIYNNFLDSFIDNNVQSDYEIVENYTEDDFIDKINSEYEFAKEQNFDSMVIVIETSGGEYTISECENGFINDNLDGVYSNIEDIAYDLHSLIDMNGDTIENFRIE